MNLTKTFVFITIGMLFCSSLVNASQIAGIDIYGYFQSELLYERSITKQFGVSDTLKDQRLKSVNWIFFSTNR